jgi:hypothetical protein
MLNRNRKRFAVVTSYGGRLKYGGMLKVVVVPISYDNEHDSEIAFKTLCECQVWVARRWLCFKR